MQHAHTGSTIKIKHEQSDSKTKAGKEILDFYFFCSHSNNSTGNNVLHLRLRKESVNIKVQRIFLPFKGTDLLMVHARSTPIYGLLTWVLGKVLIPSTQAQPNGVFQLVNQNHCSSSNKSMAQAGGGQVMVGEYSSSCKIRCKFTSLIGAALERVLKPAGSRGS